MTDPQSFSLTESTSSSVSEPSTTSSATSRSFEHVWRRKKYGKKQKRPPSRPRSAWNTTRATTSFADTLGGLSSLTDITGLSSLFDTTGFSTTEGTTILTTLGTTDIDTGLTTIVPMRGGATAYHTMLGGPSAYYTRGFPTVAYRTRGITPAYLARFRARLPGVLPIVARVPAPPVEAVEQPAPAENQQGSPRSPVRSPPFYSPPGREALTEPPPESSEESERNLKAYYIWYICALAAFPLVLPVGLVLLPLLRLGENASYVASDVRTVSTMYTTGPDVIWPGLHPSCSKKVVLKDNIEGLFKGNVSRSVWNATDPRFLFCCLYNNSRFRKPLHWDYLPKHIPFELCPCVVYWSVGVERGRLVSRVPEFDRVYGLKQLSRLKRPETKILLTVGGYPEDSFQFSRLGWDLNLVARFVVEVLDALIDFKLDGVNIHWQYPGDYCGRPLDSETLVDIVTRLRNIFRLNGKTFYITVMIPGEFDIADPFDLPKLAPKVDLLFFETHSLSFRSLTPFDACKRNDVRILAFHNSSHPAVQERMCFSATVGSWAWKAIISRLRRGGVTYRFLGPTEPHVASRISGLAAWFEFCTLSLRCVFLTSSDCELCISNVRRLGEASLYIQETKPSYQKRFSAMACALLYDIDFDIYRGGCPGTSPIDSRIRKIWYFAHSLRRAASLPSLPP